jgi:nitroimidazol reductase NimA-like FMN-containing flavoprotein (pyridoxamine 5'-phosphate oxidase superfamily)
VSSRDAIVMSDGELVAFLQAERTVICATNGPRGWPHLMPLWYVVRDGELWAWTFAKSQKVRNLERDPRATLQVEAAEAYQELRGVMLECDLVVHRELELVAALGGEILLRNSVPRGEQPPAELPPEVRDVVAAQAVKRVGLEFVERRRVSWDHRKLGGLY